MAVFLFKSALSQELYRFVKTKGHEWMNGWLRRRESGVDIRKLGEAPNPGLSDCISLRLMFPEQTTKDRSCKCTTCSFNPFQNLTKSEALLYESFRVCLQPMYNLQCQWSITAVNVNLDWIDVHELDNALLLNSWTINGLSKIWISVEKIQYRRWPYCPFCL